MKATASAKCCTFCTSLWWYSLLVVFWAKMGKAKVVLLKLTGSGDMLPMGRRWLDLHLELKLRKKLQERERQKDNMPTSSPYLCPCRDFSSGQIAAWSSLNGFTTMIVTEWGHGWYQRWIWTDIPIHSTHQPVAFRMSHLAVEQKYRQKCSETLLSVKRSKVKTSNHQECLFMCSCGLNVYRLTI